MTQLEMTDAQGRLAELVDRARSGEEIIFTDAGKPVVKLGPADAQTTSPQTPPDWKAAWRQAAGMWKDRDDIPELMNDLRREWNRVEPPEGPLE